MECDRQACRRWQRRLHAKPGIPVIYICCRCNGCRPGECPADTRDVIPARFADE